MPSLNPDFMVGCLHKWLYCPRGSGFIYSSEYASCVSPLITAFIGDTTTWADRHAYQGTTGGTNYACLIYALEFRQWLGGEVRIRAYCHEIVWKGSMLVAEMVCSESYWKWGTSVLGSEDHSGCMANVELPRQRRGDVWMRGLMVDVLLVKRGIALQIFKLGERWYARFSAQVFNEVDDFARAGRIVLEEIEENRSRL
jgi:hypothetical protein